jgi:hypothetical protein
MSPADALRRLRPFALGLLVGVGVLVVAWIVFGSGGDSLSVDAGIPPPEYVYLDNARVLAYLSQIEGGLSTSEKLTEQVSRSRNGGVSASGIQVGGSVSQEQFVERVVTPTATTRFYRLLDRLSAKSYLHTVDVADGLKAVARGLRDVPEGDFVRLRDCRVVVPSYAELALKVRTSRASLFAANAHPGLSVVFDPAAEALYNAREMLKPPNAPRTGSPTLAEVHKLPRAAMVRGAKRFVAAVGNNPRVPLASCTGQVVSRPRTLDLLFPIRLGLLNDDPSVLAGPVTIVGKLLRAVRRPSEDYLDDAAFTTWWEPVAAMDELFRRDGGSEESDMTAELTTDATALAPGVVIQPIAIYK